MRRRLRYEFDNLMARGLAAQIAVLAVMTSALVASGGVVLYLAGLGPEGEEPNLPRLVWLSLMRAMDAGAVGGDVGPWSFLFVNLFVTVGGIFVFSTLIGVLNNAIGAVLEELRKGRSFVVERDHVIVLGYTPKIARVLTELAEANSNRPGACVAVLADRDKVAMDDEIRQILGDRRLKVVSRTGVTTRPTDLAITNPGAARAVVVLAPEDAASAVEADTIVLKTLLAVTKLDLPRVPHLVAELREEASLEVAHLVCGDGAALVLSPPLISRLLVQTGRQSGLSVVYTELLDFEGNEFYMAEEPGLRGVSFRDAVLRYESSAVVGVEKADGTVVLGPWDHVFGPGDKVVAISEDDDTVHLDGRAPVIDASVIAPVAPPPPAGPERTLLLGAGSPRCVQVLAELDAYVGAGSTALVVGGPVDLPALSRITTEYRPGDYTDRRVLDTLDVASFDNVLVLAETEGRSPELADARTLVTLLHLRDLARRTGRAVPVTSEMLDIENQRLASVAEADDFIVSNTLVSLILTQLAENPKLKPIFDDLLDPEGYEIYLRPVEGYVRTGVPVDFYTVTEAAAQRGHVAMGHRILAHATDAARAYGVTLNPRKSVSTTYAPGDRIVVLAADV